MWWACGVAPRQVVAWDPVEKKLLPFQTLSTRKRKDEKAENVKVRVILQVGEPHHVRAFGIEKGLRGSLITSALPCLACPVVVPCRPST